ITGRPIAEQRLYLPSAGYSVLLAALLLKMTERGRRLTFAVAVLVLMLLAAGLVDRSFAWRTSASFWADTVAKSPRQGRDHYYYGVNCLGRGRTKAAFHHFQTAVAANPHLTDAYDEMAKLHAARKEWDEAEACARKATTISPWWPEGHNTLGVVFGLQGRYAEAAAAFNEALRIQPAHADARRNLALAYRKLGLADQAARAARPVTMPFSTGRKAGSGPAVTWSPE
ncbi:MAG: tetratricopeptide repeat protein, partial [Planctomycetes bacterium]|nr:tetratricopeptide repeat protein [Planctomycetota bacterium]